MKKGLGSVQLFLAGVLGNEGFYNRKAVTIGCALLLLLCGLMSVYSKVDK